MPILSRDSTVGALRLTIAGTEVAPGLKFKIVRAPWFRAQREESQRKTSDSVKFRGI